MADAKFNVEVGYTMDKNSYNQLMDSLKRVEAEAQNVLEGKVSKGKGMEKEFQAAGKAAKDLQDILNQSWDKKLNQINLTKLNNGLKQMGTTASQTYATIAKASVSGAEGANLFARNVLEANIELTQTNKLLDKMAITLGNTIRYGISSSIFNTFTNSIRNAYEYTKQLDTSLNDIRIVSGKNAQEMNQFAISANKAAQALGKTTLDYTKAATIYFQQGLDTDEVAKRTEVTLKAANVTGQSAQEVSEQLTAVWNGYQVQAEQLELYVDKLAAVAAHSASNLEELSTGMSKVASAANVMGVSIDQLNAQMSTIISVTRQAPESVGTALRTIYARIADIKAGIDGDTSLGNYSGKMAKLGFNVLDASGNLKDMGSVIEEIGGKWETLTREQQISLAQTMAGTRQYNNLLTLFDNWDKYTEALSTSKDAAGTLQQQQDIYMESTEAHLKQLRAEAEDLYKTLFDQDAARGFIDLINGALKGINGYIKTLGGGFNAFLGMGAQIANLFSGQIANGINTKIENWETKREQKENVKSKEEIIQSLKADYKSQGKNVGEESLQLEAKYAEKILAVRKNLSQEEFKELTNEQKKLGLLEDQKEALEKQKAELIKRKDAQLNDIDLQRAQENRDKELNFNSIAEISKEIGDRENQLYSITGEEERKAEQAIIEALKERLGILEKIRDTDISIKEKTQEQAGIEQGINDKTGKAKRKGDIKDTIKWTTALLQGATIATGMINTLSSETANADEKANALFNGIVGGVSAALNAWIPGLGMVAQLAGGLLDNLGVTKWMSEWFKTAADREQEEIDNLKKFSEDMNAEYDKLSDKVSNLESQWDRYTSVIDTLDKCKEGTKEWEKALQDVNQTVANILKEYPELAKLKDVVIVGQNGQLELNDAVYAEYIQKLQNEAIVKQYTSIAAGNEANRRQLDLDKNSTRQRYANDLVGQILDREFHGGMYSEVGETRKQRQETLNNALGLDEASFNSLIEKAANNPSEYYAEIESLAKNMVDLGYATEEEAQKWQSSMEDNINSLQDLDTRTNDYSITLANSMKMMTNAMYGGEGANSLKTVLYTAEYQRAEQETMSAKDLHDYWAYKKNNGLDIHRGTGKEDDEYKALIADINQRIGNGKYQAARDVSDADVVQGDDGSDKVYLYNTVTGQDEAHTLEEWARIVHEEEKIRASLKKDINKVTSDYIKGLQEQTGIEKETLEKVFSDGFNISQLSEEEAAQLQAHQEQITAYYKDITKNITDEDAKKIADDVLAGITQQFETGWDAKTHAEEIKKQFLSTLKSAASAAAEEFELDKDDIEQFGQHLASLADQDDVADLADTLKDDAKAVAFVARSIIRMNDAIEELNKNQEDWIDILKNSNAASEEYWRTVEGLQDVFGDLLNLTKDAQEYLNGEFFKKQAEDIKLAADGDAEAIDRLRQATLEEIALKIKLDTENYTNENLLADVQNLQSMIDNLDLKIEPGVDIDDTEFVNACNAMIEKAGLTQDQVNDLFSGMGYDVTYAEEPQKVKQTVTITNKHHEIRNMSEDGRSWDEIETVDPPTYKEIDGEVTSFGMATSEPGTKVIPKINKITKGAGGSSNNFSSSNKGGGSAGGKKGGGGGSKAKPSKKDPNKDELDRYQLVNVQLKEISKQLSKLDKEKNKLLGGNLVKNLNNQIKLLNDQITVTEAKLKIAKQEQAEVAGKLSGYGIKFDNEGNIANYAAIFKQEQAKLNAVYTNYNNMSKDAQEAYEDTVKSAEESWNKFKESITKYDNLIGETIPSLQQDIQDAFDKQTQMYIEEFNAEIKVRLDMSSAERDWNEFKRKVIDGIKDDDILGMATAKLKDFYSYYNEAGTAEIQALTKQLQGQLEELRKQDDEGSADWYRDNRVKAIEDLKDNYDKIRKSLTDIVELEEEMQQKLLDMLNEAQEKFDDQVDTFENINKQLEHNIELINLLTDQNDYEVLAQQYAAQTKNRKEELDFYTKQKEFWEMYLTTLEQGSKEWEVAKEKYNAAAEAWASALETTIQAARQEFENNINLIFKTINNQLTNNKGLDYLNEEWELLADNSDLVLDNINKMQKMQDLTKKYNDAINSTSNIKAQQTLAQLRDSELDSLKAMGQLSEKDLERAEKKLDIVKAQIALEDAQRNKSQMRLRRDSQGNYRYQFVADEDQINQAQQNLYSAYNELYNFDKSRYTETLKQAADAWKEYQEKMAEAALINDPEMRAQKEALIKEQYDEQIGILHEQLQRTMQELNESTFAELNALYAENEDNYELMTLEQQAALNDFNAANQTAFDLVFNLYTENTEKFHDMAQDQIDVIQNQMVPQWTSGYQDLVDAITGEGGIEEVSNRLMDEMQTAVDDYNTSLEETEAVAGNTFETISNAENEVIQLTQDMLDENDVLIDKYEELTNAVGDQYQMLKDLMSEYEDAANKAKEAAEDAYEYIMKAKEAEAKDYAENVDTGPTTGGTGRYEGTQNLDTTTVTPVAKTEPNPPFSATLPRGTALYNANGYQYPKSAKADRAVTVEAEVNGRYRVWGSTFSPHTVYVDKNAVRYDTGGYTGAWGTEGRMAMLHEKELVLNKKDTANMLNAVDILRGITDNIGADVLDKMASMKANGLNMAMGANAIDQNVHIEATFPGVTSSIEIQDALNNLVNMAAQRATRTR